MDFRRRTVVIAIAVLALVLIGAGLAWGVSTGRISFRANTNEPQSAPTVSPITTVNDYATQIDALAAQMLEPNIPGEQLDLLATQRNALQVKLLRIFDARDVLLHDQAVQAFNRSAIPAETASEMHLSDQKSIEHLETLSGRMSSSVIDLINGTSEEHFYLNPTDPNQQKVELRFEEVYPPISGYDKVQITGHRLGNYFVIQGVGDELMANVKGTAPTEGISQVESLTSNDQTLVAGVQTQSVAVVRFTYPEFTGQLAPNSLVKQFVFGSGNTTIGYKTVNNFYKETARNGTGVKLVGIRDVAGGDVFGPYTITAPAVDSGNIGGSCNYDLWADEAKALAIQRDGMPTNYNKIIYIAPLRTAANPGCSFRGIAWSQGGRVNGFGRKIYDAALAFTSGELPSTWPDSNVPVISHEFGHTLGLSHANKFTCISGGRKVPFDEALMPCQIIELGDPFDAMGVGYFRHFNDYYLKSLGWLSPQNSLAVAQNGNYNLYPSNLDVTGPSKPQLIYMLGDGGKYYLEYRRPTGYFDNFLSTDKVVNGVSIRFAPNQFNSNGDIMSFLLGANTSNTNDYDYDSVTHSFNQPLAVGQTMILRNSGIIIKTLSANSTMATVQLGFTPPGCVAHPPTLTVTPTTAPTIVRSQITAGTGRVYPSLFTVNVKNNNTTPCTYTGPSSFTPSLDISSGDIQNVILDSFSPTSLSLAPGETKSLSVNLKLLRGGSNGIPLLSLGVHNLTFKVANALQVGNNTVSSLLKFWVTQ